MTLRCTSRVASLVGIALAACLGSAAGKATLQSVLSPGVLDPECRSALHVGPVSCDESQSSFEDRIEASGSEPRNATNRADLEREEAKVEAYLASYGKPPREAVRAILDPSDQNIAQWHLAQERTMALASYLGSRLTDLQLEAARRPLAQTTGAESRLQILASLALVQMPGDPAAQAARDVLAQVARQTPGLSVSVEFAGVPKPGDFDSIGPNVEVHRTSIEPERKDTLPWFRIESAGTASPLVLPARNMEAASLQAILLSWCGEHPECNPGIPRTNLPDRSEVP